MTTERTGAVARGTDPSWLTARNLRERWPRVSYTGIWLVVAMAASAALAVVHSPLVPLPGVITLLLVPGATIMSMLETRSANPAARVVLAVCLSMMVIMVVGGVASLLGPHIGVAHPLNSLPESVVWFLIAVVVLVIGDVRHRDPVTWIFEGVRTTHVYCALGGGILVVLSILGAAQLDHSGNYRLAVFATALDVAVLLAAVIGGWSSTSRWPLSSLLYSVSLALLVSTSLRGGHLYGWDVQQEFGDAWNTIHAGVWVIPKNRDPYSSMLSLTVLPAVLHSLVKLRLLAFFQLVVPAILALLPLAVFSTIRSVPRWITSGRTVPRPGLAFGVVVGLVVSSVAFSSELVSITRQAMALTMLTALVMVLFDRTMSKRPSQIIICLLIVAISFTHYTTSYLLATVLLCAWPVGFMWSKGWLGTPRSQINKHRYDVRSRRIINVVLVAVSLVAALGWNLVITRNDALGAPSNAVTAKGAGLAASTGTVSIPPRQFERLLEREFRKTDSWIRPVPGSGSVRLVSATARSSKGIVSSLKGPWKELTYLAIESLWVMLGISLLYGLFRLGRRRSYEYSSDLVGLAVAGLAIGGFLRFSGTLAAYYDPERAAILTAILLAAPLTLFLDDAVSFLRGVRHGWLPRVFFGGGVFFVAALVFDNTGLGALFFGGEPPGSLSAGDWNAQNFAASTSEWATAVWLRNNVSSSNVVQSDFTGQIVLLSEPGGYHLVPEVVPPEVDSGSYIYVSTFNLVGRQSQAEADSGAFQSLYKTPIQFFNRYFHVVYSTGATRVYH
ncbi:MAG: hypothetical protein ACYDB2_03765 [Acidimicrobiales bacterium]